jgi:HAD superfamily hydrolase (TIGR01509 family)
MIVSSVGNLPHALLLDMDGTLTEPMLDFAAIRADMGIGQEPILEAMARMDNQRLAHAQSVLHRHETAAAEAATLHPGCHQLLTWLSHAGLRTALVTRNSRHCADLVSRRHGLSFDATITRDDGPFKPDPAAVFLACQKIGVAPEDTWIVGDGIHDIEAGLAAGIRTVWLSLGRDRPFAAQPWRVVKDLIELNDLLRQLAS